MLLELKRFFKTSESTISRLYVNSEFFCYCLEDVDRGLKQDMPIQEINSIKIYGKTAIPEGTYKIVLTWSNRFKRTVPLLLNVPGFDGIRIHSGNIAADTAGCLLPGQHYSTDFVYNSRAAFVELYSKLSHAAEHEEIEIRITSEK